MRRVDIQAILSNPAQRRELMIRAIMAIQSREGIKTTRKQAAWAYESATKKSAANGG